MTLTRGQELAAAQIAEIVACSRGALELLNAPAASEHGLRIPLSVATRSYRRAGGLAFRDRERLVVYVGEGFPLRPPSLYFAHRRFAGTPHIQWGCSICLYQSVEAEWNPADGMFGFMERVDAWLTAAGAGELDPIGAPLHPPVAYVASKTCVVVRSNAPVADGLWIGRADLATVSPFRKDLVGWASIGEWDHVPLAGEPAVAVLLAEPMPTEYPTGVNDLLNSLEAAGVEFDLIWPALRLVAVLTDAGQPGHFVLGAPMRRRAAGEPLRPHLAVWEIATEDLEKLRDYIAGGEDEAENRRRVAEWMVDAKVGWCEIMEDRTEVTNRRDQGTTAAGVAGKSIALLGCGALGSAVGEMLVRAGAAHLRLVDRGRVSPGLLVRQRFADADIGRHKAKALKDRLDGLGQRCVVEAEVRDLQTGVFAALEEREFDLVIDATASRTVAHRLEIDLAQGSVGCPIITMALSARAENGSVAVRMPEHVGGPIAIERAIKLRAFQRDSRHPLVQAFWPDEPPQLILPEPGCSNPTFIGSAADVDHHAAGLLNLGLARAGTLEPGQASMDLCASAWSAIGNGSGGRLSYEVDSPLVLEERARGYAAYMTLAARRGIDAEIRRIARVRSSKVETGGLIFGEIDESNSRIWLDSVSGPPPDSEMSAEAFLCGTAGTVALAKRRREASGGSSRFVGIWHTHPISIGEPSAEDMRAMVQLLLLQPHPPRHVVMMIVGFAETRAKPNLYLFHRNDFHLVIENAAEPEGKDG